ncbi:MAG: hypothetical protein M0R76_02445 [Proteobacteria bacterium]|jgi:hypothetical protein|nr:hypothetical protein [Pseudomonadota bacterium]NLN62856.1 hypothetical protein [Myxococcales bacterium]
MGTNRMFWPQAQMDEWVLDEKAVIADNVLSLHDDPLKYALHQALHFVADVADGTDPHQLVGKVKEVQTVLEMGAEHYMDSVILGDAAYQVVQGFTGVPIFEPATAPSVSNISQAVKKQTGDAEQDERELLANFLLEKL